MMADGSSFCHPFSHQKWPLVLFPRGERRAIHCWDYLRAHQQSRERSGHQAPFGCAWVESDGCIWKICWLIWIQRKWCNMFVLMLIHRVSVYLCFPLCGNQSNELIYGHKLLLRMKMRLLYKWNINMCFRRSQVAKTTGRSLENHQRLPKGVDVDPDCVEYAAWKNHPVKMHRRWTWTYIFIYVKCLPTFKKMMFDHVWLS